MVDRRWRPGRGWAVLVASSLGCFSAMIRAGGMRVRRASSTAGGGRRWTWGGLSRPRRRRASSVGMIEVRVERTSRPTARRRSWTRSAACATLSRRRAWCSPTSRRHRS